MALAVASLSLTGSGVEVDTSAIESYIVQTRGVGAAHLIEGVGGHVSHELRLIGAAAAEGKLRRRHSRHRFIWSDTVAWNDGFIRSDLYTEALFTESWVPQE